ncbi:hypothetical protein ACWGFX_18335 [Streptomyces xanthophaeus]
MPRFAEIELHRTIPSRCASVRRSRIGSAVPRCGWWKRIVWLSVAV